MPSEGKLGSVREQTLTRRGLRCQRPRHTDRRNVPRCVALPLSTLASFKLEGGKCPPMGRRPEAPRDRGALTYDSSRLDATRPHSSLGPSTRTHLDA